MVDREQLADTLRRLRERMRSDPELFAYVDRSGDGHIDAEEWDHARRAILRKLERRMIATGPTADEAHETPEREPPAPSTPPPRITACDHLSLEREVDLTQPKRFGPCLIRTLRAGADRVELARFEQLATWLEARGRRRRNLDLPMVEYSIRPLHEEPIQLHRRPTMIGEEVQVQSQHGRTIARVLPRSRLLRYAYEVQAEDGRTLTLDRKPWDERCERGYNRTSGNRTRPEKKPPAPYRIMDDQECWAGFVNREAFLPDERKPQRFFDQWVVRLQEGSLTPALRWGLIGAFAFILHRPFFARGLLWDIFRGDRR